MEQKNQIKIYTVGEDILKKKCRKVTKEEVLRGDMGSVVKTLSQALGEFRAQHGFGRAVAAPQVGFTVQAVGMNLGEVSYSFSRHQYSKSFEGYFTMFNPEITQTSAEKFSMWDDCMSFPDKYVRVSRHVTVTVK